MSFYQRLQIETQHERAQLLAQPLFADALAGRVTVPLYIAFLSQAFHHVKHTVPLMMACGARLGDDREWLRAKIAAYIEEEYGHHEWVLDDIAASGGDADTVRRGAPSFETEMMVAYAYDLIARGNPAGFFGMVHVLEGTSTALATQAAQRIASALKLPGKAFRYLSSHGSLDLEHVDFFRGLVERMTAADQQAVVCGAKRFYRLYGDIFANLHREHTACN
ncbi:MAG: Pyrroloquinoline quinone biosynthesis protein [Hydrocarboniphaga sp.]|uniref:TenA family transcriptional regulator n=1 Tax=Hydrocarboniphaga sp. TaxID=2033016 RepID=UPI002605A02B|nr:iron-containing redox enzyme family protein [Hydrocarboniphaga sp.]MDB5972550.1 Pyrroloquinoline quinone biosynthesis protein [Hydrocarboniphaga sp.]